MKIYKNELSFFDCNAFIGIHNNPYIESPFGVRALEKNIEDSGLQECMIYHSASVLYDPAYGNELLIEQAKNKIGLYFVWVVVPEYFNTERETEFFFSKVIENKISAIKIFPRYHSFNLTNGSMDNFLSYLNSKRIPLLVDQEEISWEEISYILKNHPDIYLLLQNVGYRMERYISPFLEKYKNFYLDISRYQAHGGIEYLCGRFGSERLLFGSAMPIFSPEPIMTMIYNAKVSWQEKENISSKNLLRLVNHD